MRLIGQTLGKYRVTEHLGSGGMSEVYKAYQPGLDRYVAIKVLHSFLAQEEDFLTRFQREAKFAAMLRHPNIIQVYDFDYDEGTSAYYMVMEYINGANLKTRLQEMAKRSEMVPLGESIRIVTAIANALDYAHQRGMVHRDIKPANIMFNEDSEPILTDFGIAKMVDVAGLTASGAMVGTPAYMAPEQGMGQAGDERSDIYSLGVVLYQLTTGHRPFDADTPLGVALKHINAPLPPPVVVNPDLPKSIEVVTLKALAKDPDKRYQTAKEFATALKKAAAGESIELSTSELLAATAPPYPTNGHIPSDDTGWETATLPSAPAIHPTPVTPPAAKAPIARRRLPWATMLAGSAAVLVVIGIVALFATGIGQRMLSAIGPPSPTPTTVEGTPVNLLSTEVAAQLATRDAISTLETTLHATLTPSPTPSPSSTPTLTPDANATSTASCTFDLEVIGDPPVWPPVLVPGQTFTKIWTVKNTGTCPWPMESQLVFASGKELEVVEVVERPTLGQLAPGETAEVRVTLRAPDGFDTYDSVWQLQYSGGAHIGEGLTIVFEVGLTPTPMPTVTPSPTPTPQVTPTPSEPLWMGIPSLAWCNEPANTQGRVEWGHGGGPSSEYRFFHGKVSPETELDGPYRAFEGFPHTETYFTASGTITFPVPEECGRGDEGRCGSQQAGFEIVWQKVYFTPGNCP
jgi:serine/threonine protein kinase